MEAVTAEPGRLRVFEALRHRDFRLLWSGQAVSLLGDMAFLTALGWKAFTLAGSSRLGVVLLGLAAGELATLLVGGALADRYERRRMMIVSDVWRFAAVGALAAVDATGHLTFPLLVGIAVVVGLGDGFFYPAVGGIVPLVVEQPALPSANSLMGVARWGSVMVGPSLAAFAYGAGGASTVFAFDAATFLVAAAPRRDRLRPLAREQLRDRRDRPRALVRARVGARGRARSVPRVRHRDLGDDAPGARAGAPARPRDQPRLLRQLRADADRARDLGGDREPRRAGHDDRDRSVRVLRARIDRAHPPLAVGGRLTVRTPAEILRDARTIAVVGASPRPNRPSHDVMRYLLQHGYRVIPVRPRDCDEVLGVPCVASLAEIGEPVDLVDVFRRPEFCADVAREAVAAGAGALWLQRGVLSPEARQIATEAGLDYVEDLCTAIVHRHEVA